MEIQELLNYRKDLLEESKDDHKFISENNLLNQVLPLLLEAKLIDSEDFNESYFLYNEEKLKVNGYCINESGERLQLFIVNEQSIDLNANDASLQVAQRGYYDGHFARTVKFANKAAKNHLADIIQDSGPVQVLSGQLSSAHGTEQFDVIEIFLISLTASVEPRGESPQPRKFSFEDEEIKISYTKGRDKHSKEILIIKKLIDLNFLFNIIISLGNRDALVIDFIEEFNEPLEAIMAADEEHFESYLCAMPAKVISHLYKRHSTRLLEKNVRSFLQFKGVNKGIRETIKDFPEKFIAYNNGLTITSTAKEITKINDKYFIKSLTDFQIVNGGQTTASIYFTQKDGFDISKVKVMAKINVAKNVTEEQMEDLITKISRYSNSQSKVSNVDLRSRNPQLNKLKSLSESVLTPTGLKWFFEKSKGEYNTLLRKAGSKRPRFERDYPKSRRFSKEELGKYYTAWGSQPYMVKKGGEKVFRYFIEEISGEGRSKKEQDINRFFYEELISKIILFRSLENIYGQGKNSKGQLRSAAVPYSLSVLYDFTTGSDQDIYFDLQKIWLQEELKDDLETFFDELLTLMNDLIKKYSASDDYGEYSKKPELWEKICECKEVVQFMSSKKATSVLAKYTIKKSEYLKKQAKFKQSKDLNFEFLIQASEIYSNSADYYKKLKSMLSDQLTKSEVFKLEKIIEAIQSKSDLTQSHIDFEISLSQKIRAEMPHLFDKLTAKTNNEFTIASNFLVKEYNYALQNGIKIPTHFTGLRIKHEKKGSKFTAVFDTIGKAFEKGALPSMKDVSLLGSILAN